MYFPSCDDATASQENLAHRDSGFVVKVSREDRFLEVAGDQHMSVVSLWCFEDFIEARSPSGEVHDLSL